MKLKHILTINNDTIERKYLEDILNSNYNVSSTSTPEETMEFLRQTVPDLILLDMNRPHFELINIINSILENELTKKITIIAIVNEINNNTGLDCLKLGIMDFIEKPIKPETLLSRVSMHLEFINYKKLLEAKIEENTATIEHLQDTMILGLAELVECRDENTGGHVKRTAKYVEILVDALAEANIYSDILTPEMIKDIKRSAPLHDIGKIGISDSTLLKAGSLSETEYEYIKKHAKLGGETLQKMLCETNKQSFLYTARDMAYYHHEKWDGTGYPKALKGEEIPISARIMAIADVYDALTTKRPYKEPFSHKDAVFFIVSGKSKMFDPAIVEVFKDINIRFENEYIKLNSES